MPTVTAWLIAHQNADGGWSAGGASRGEAMWAVLGLVSLVEHPAAQERNLQCIEVAGRSDDPDGAGLRLARGRGTIERIEVVDVVCTARRSVTAEADGFDTLEPPEVDPATLNGPQVTELMTEAGLL